VSREVVSRRRRFAVGKGSADRRFDTWKAKYDGLEVSEARRLKALEEENAKLKKLDTSINCLNGID
jgi:hypothetical protein